MAQWTPTQVRKTILFLALIGVGIYLMVSGGTTDVTAGGINALLGVGQALID